MREGKPISINWEQYRSPGLELKPKNIRGGIKGCCQNQPFENCVSGTIELFSGIPASEHDKQIKDFGEGWHTKDYIKYIRKLGFTIFELTQYSVTKSLKEINWHQFFPIKDDHLLMIGSQLDWEDSSTFLLHKGVLYHHAHIEPGYNHLYFINKPIIDICLIWHPSWVKKQDKPKPYSSFRNSPINKFIGKTVEEMPGEEILTIVG